MFIYLLVFPYEIAFHIGNAIKLCLYSVVPSLFMYICLANFVTDIILKKEPKSKATKFLSDLFALPEFLVPACIMGLICGAPSGGISVCRLYKNGRCTKQEAESALVLSNNCSAVFITSIAASVLESKAFAYIILFSNIMATITVYFLFFRKNGTRHVSSCVTTKKISVSQTITDSISSSVFSCINLCGYIVFFYTLSSVISGKLLFVGCNESFQALFKSGVMCFFEMSSGILSCSMINGNERIIAVCSGIAFCGISIFLQVKSIADKCGLSSKKFILSKVICAIVSPLITLALLIILPQKAVSASYQVVQSKGGIGIGETLSLTIIVCLFIIGWLVLSYLDKNHKTNS
ncbi:MAG: hypothetical protein E7600_07190 [Ruminococcaceae bacterium]|nr:hypothetical protein [Oscillospiraceae bacterium]